MSDPLKVTFLGKSGVGKTSIFSLICGAQTPPVGPTIGVEFATVFVPEFTMRIQIWDTAGMERFAPVTNVCLRNTAAIVLVYAVNDTSSFDELATRWLPFIERERRLNRNTALKPNPLIFVVGNKNDLTGGAHLTSCEMESAWARTIDAIHVTTTTTSTTSISDFFAIVCRELSSTNQRQLRPTQFASENLTLSVLDDFTRLRLEEKEERKKKSSCC